MAIRPNKRKSVIKISAMIHNQGLRFFSSAIESVVTNSSAGLIVSLCRPWLCPAQEELELELEQEQLEVSHPPAAHCPSHIQKNWLIISYLHLLPDKIEPILKAEKILKVVGAKIPC